MVGIFFVATVVYVEESLRLDDAGTVYALLMGTLGAGTAVGALVGFGGPLLLLVTGALPALRRDGPAAPAAPDAEHP